MKEETLQLIGRRHTVSQTEQAFEMARRVGLDCINADLIAGLPGESFEDFCSSLQRIAGAERQYGLCLFHDPYIVDRHLVISAESQILGIARGVLLPV